MADDFTFAKGLSLAHYLHETHGQSIQIFFDFPPTAKIRDKMMKKEVIPKIEQRWGTWIPRLHDSKCYPFLYGYTGDGETRGGYKKKGVAVVYVGASHVFLPVLAEESKLKG